MRRDMRRFSVWVGLVLLLALIVMSGCSRSKSSGPSEGTEEAGATTQSPDGEPVASMSVEEATNATAVAMVATTTAEAQEATQTAGEPQTTVVSVTPEPTESTTPVEATPVPQPTKESETVTATKEPSGATGATTHTVQAGENLYRIALNHGLTYQALAAHNGITNPNLIFPGQELKIPASGGTVPTPSGDGSYTVQVGDNLFRVALAYNMLFTDLASANGLSYPYTIYPGQRLTIP